MINGVLSKNIPVVSTDIINHIENSRLSVWTNGKVCLSTSYVGKKIYLQAYQLAIVAEIQWSNISHLFNNIEQYHENSEIELVAKLYKKYGIQFAEKIRGEFAIVIWDDLKEELVCISDIFKSRTIYYFNDNNIFTFSDDLYFLSNVPGVTRAPDLIKIANLSIHPILYVATECRTIFSNINYIPGATILKIVNNIIIFHKYWEPSCKDKPIYFKHELDYISAFNDLFAEVLKSNINSNLKNNTGLMLSGGLDSAAIAATLNEIIEDNCHINCLSFILPKKYAKQEYEEEKSCIELLQTSKLNIEYRELKPINFNKLVEYAMQGKVGETGLAYCDNSSHLKEWANLYKIKNVLTGVYGEFGPSYLGYEYCSKFFLSGMWQYWLSESYSYAKRVNKSVPIILLKSIIKSFMPKSIQFSCGLLLNDKFVQHNSNLNHIKSTFQKNWYYGEKPHILNQRQNQVNMLKHLQYKLSLNYNDGLINLIMPYCDRRIIEFCLRIPDKLYFHNGYNRYLIRKAMENKLPPQILNRMVKFNQNSNTYYNDHYIKSLPQAADIFDKIKKHQLVKEIINVPELHNLINSKIMGNYKSVPVTRIVAETLGLGVFLSTF